MVDKPKNKDKIKRTPKRLTMPILIIGAVIIIGLGAGGLFLWITGTKQPDFAYTDRCGVHLYDMDSETVIYSFPDECTMIHGYDFSADGERVVYINNEGDLILAQVQPFQVQQVIPYLEDVTAVDWSPDGTKIALWAGTELPTGQELLIYDVESETLFEHGTYSVRYTSLAWSPNSQELIFATDHMTDMELVHYNTETQEITPLTDDPYLNRYAVWNGRTAIYSRYDAETGHDALWMLDLTTGDMSEIIGARAARASVSPDGRYMTYSATDSEGYPALFIMNLASYNITQITPHEPENYLSQWMPTADYTPTER